MYRYESQVLYELIFVAFDWFDLNINAQPYILILYSHYADITYAIA